MGSVGIALISNLKKMPELTGSPGVFPVRLDLAQKAFFYKQPQLSIDCLGLLPAQGMLISNKALIWLKACYRAKGFLQD